MKRIITFILILTVIFANIEGLYIYAKADTLKFTFIKNSTKVSKTYEFSVNADNVQWAVSDESKAEISNEGIFVPKKIGKVTVSVTDGVNSISKKITIKGKKKIAIDPGHQTIGMSSTEPIGPGAKKRKPKVTGGATGVATGIPEYKFALTVGKKLKKELENRGYEVYMIRTKNNVRISNVERAKMANNSGSNAYIRLHADSSESSAITGASGLYPSASNPYVGSMSKKCKKLTKCVLNSYCKKTGIKNRGAIVRNDLSGTNWSKIPVTLIELGFMSNAAEDRKINTSSFQKKMVKGMADGMDKYFGFK